MPTIAMLFPYIVLAAGVSLCLCALLVFRAELERQARGRAEDQKQLLEAVRQLEGRLDDIKRHRPPTPAPAASAEPRVPMSRRAQILRLARQGESPNQISAALGVPIREVTLILEISGRQPEPVQ